MRTAIVNLAKMMIILIALNCYVLFQDKHWIYLAINIVYGIIVLPIFFSHAKWNKRPPKQEETRDEKK